MSQLTAEGKTDEEIPVYVWYQDIDQEEVEEQTEKATGTSRLDLDKMITVEENDESTDDLDLDMYLEKTEDQRQEVADLTEEFINTQRTLAKEAYQEQYEEINEEFEIEEEKVLYKSKCAPMVIARIKCGEIEQLVKGEQVQNIDLYEAVDVESEGCNFKINESVKSITKNALYKEKVEIQTTGLTGKRSLIGVLEDGAPYVEGDDVRSMHEDIVCGIITNLAPDAYVYYTYMVQGNTDPCGLQQMFTG